MHPVLFYRPGERLSLPELSAARLDGDVIEIGEGYMPCDTIEGVAARALSLSPLVPKGAAVSGASAAWVHGAGDSPPRIHHLTRLSTARQRFTPSIRVVHHDRLLTADEVVTLAGVQVTTPRTTALSLLFSAGANADDERWLRALVGTAPELLISMREHVQHCGRRPGLVHALKLLDEWGAVGAEDQDVVTRYTS